MTERVVLDAWALLAYLQGERPAGSVVGSLLAEDDHRDLEVHASMINMGEVYYRMGKAEGRDKADRALGMLQRLPIVIHPAENDVVLAAARWKMMYPISYADAFAVATAVSLDAQLVTGDPELVRLQGHIRVWQLGRSRG